MGIIKGVLTFVNFVLFAFGATLIGFGIYSISVFHQYDIFKLPEASYLSIGMVCLGAFILVTSFFGCCGTIKESKLLIGLYIFVLLLAIAAQTFVGVYAFKYRDDTILFDSFETKASEIWNKDMTEKQKWEIEEELNCCGGLNTNSSTAGCQEKLKTTVTCFAKAEEFVKNHLQTFSIVSLSIAAVQILFLFAGCYVYASIPSKSEERAKLLESARAMNREYN